MPRPLSKDDLLVLATIARAQPRDNPPDETIVERLAKAGLVTSRRGRLVATDAGKAMVEQRRAANAAADAAAAAAAPPPADKA
jgi:hypothetical protein